jgi:hypothetical protein
MLERRYHIHVSSTAERLRSIGPVIPGAWARHDDELQREIRGDFLLDTGAYGAMIDLAVAEALQLRLLGAKQIHGIHGYGTLQRYCAKLILPATAASGTAGLFEQVMECVAVPSLREKSSEQNADIVGILGRLFLQNAHLEIDGSSGRLVLQIGRFG